MKEETIGQRIRRLRKMRHWNQARLAEEAGLGRAETISNIERGKVEPRLSTLAKIANAFDLHPRDLLGRAAPDGPRD